MSERMQRLAAQLEMLPEPADTLQKVNVTLMKAQGKVLARVPEMTGSTEEKRKILETSTQTVNTVSGMVGSSHPGVVILRQMIDLAAALVEGRPEPPEPSAAKAKSGCAIWIGVGAALLGMAAAARACL